MWFNKTIMQIDDQAKRDSGLFEIKEYLSATWLLP